MTFSQQAVSQYAVDSTRNQGVGFCFKSSLTEGNG